jgi:hypothetical protein
MATGSKTKSKKESKILGILYWRCICKQLLVVLRELQQIRNQVGAEALKQCELALQQFRNNLLEQRKLEQDKKKREKQSRPPPTC